MASLTDQSSTSLFLSSNYGADTAAMRWVSLISHTTRQILPEGRPKQRAYNFPMFVIDAAVVIVKGIKRAARVLLVSHSNSNKC